MFDFGMTNIQSVLKMLILLVGLFIGKVSISQVYTDTLTEEETVMLQKRLEKELRQSQKNLRFQFLPLIYYTPETKMAFGASGIFSFKTNVNDSLLETSMVTPTFIYTLNNQLLTTVRYDLHLNRKWYLFGDVGYIIYPYFFAGIGNLHNGDYKEWYDAQFPVFSTNIYRKVYKETLSVGLIYEFQKTKITSQSDSLLIPGEISGAGGSTQSSMGLGVKYDSRNYQLAATSGWFADVSITWADKGFGASYQDQFIKLDLRRYITLSKKSDVLALQVYSEIHSGDVPFNLMSMLGGSQLMRGYQQGVYRDRQMLVYQAEYRSRLFFKYFGFAIFGNYGAIGNDFADVNKNYRYTYGAGLRFSPLPEKRYFIRFDYGRGENTNGFYFAVGEAF